MSQGLLFLEASGWIMIEKLEPSNLSLMNTWIFAGRLNTEDWQYAKWIF